MQNKSNTWNLILGSVLISAAFTAASLRKQQFQELIN
jgi:hypothetical protein